MTVALPVRSVRREKLLTTARLLPAASQVFAGWCDLLRDVNSDLSRIATPIRVDSA